MVSIKVNVEPNETPTGLITCGFLSYKHLLRLLNKMDLTVFIIYCISTFYDITIYHFYDLDTNTCKFKLYGSIISMYQFYNVVKNPEKYLTIRR